MKFNERRLVFRIDEAERVNAEPFHESQRAWDCPVGHDPHDHVHALGRQADEVPEIVVRRLRLRKSAIRLLLGGMDQIRKLDRILYEENRDVVANNVPIALLSVKLDRKATNVA